MDCLRSYFNIIIVILALLQSFSCSRKYDYDIILRGGMVVDGTGAPGYISDIGIIDGVIKTIGKVSGTARSEIIVRGKIISPGFIDTHSHHDEGMFKNTDMSGALTQGITTVFIGQDGSSYYPMSNLIDKIKNNPVAINVGSFTGHNTIRDMVMGVDFKRTSTINEIKEMDSLLIIDLGSGSWGLSSGLEYDPGIYSNTNEIISLAKTVSKFNASYISHIRSEDRYFWDAIEEIITIGKEADIPVQISHIKLAMMSLVGKTDKLLNRLDLARKNGVQISADIYPYTYWQSTMQVLFPDRDFLNKSSADFALSEITTPDGVIISTYTPESRFEGMRLNEVAAIYNQDPSITLMNMIQATLNENESESIIAKSMNEKDIIALLNWEYTNLCTDGGSTGGHPRGYGSYPKVLSEYVRQKSFFTLEEAIHKMTGAPSNNMRLKRRGLITTGMAADLIIFDFNKIKDKSTFENPRLICEGIDHVLVNGKFVVKNRMMTENRPGIFLQRVKHKIID